MGDRIEGHGSGPTFGDQLLDDGKLVGRIFVRDGDRAVAVRAERELGARVEGIGIDSVTDRYGRDYFPGVLSIIAINLLWQPANSRWWAVSIAKPDASSPGAMGHVLTIWWVLVSMATTMLWSSMLS